MTDDSSAMDKKNCTIPLPKSSSNQDLSSARSSLFKQDALIPKGNPRRRLELPVNKPNGQFKSESTARKYSPQKNRGQDRKPRTRGNNPGESLGKNEHEVGSLQSPGGKKRDWDNLFYFAPRERASQTSWRYHNSLRGRNDSGGSASKNKFSKENYLQANCQFMVKAGEDYSAYQADPDTLVDWNVVEQIIVTMVGEGASCPICLGPPVAAKMTRCGHLFCWSCMLHYLALSDQKYRPCPICYEHVCNKDLKSVVTNVHFDVELGDIIDMELLCRPKDILSVCPLNRNDATSNWNVLYSKLLVVTHEEVTERVINREHVELLASLEEDPNCPEVCFTHQAITELNERKEALLCETVGVTKLDKEHKANEKSNEELDGSILEEEQLLGLSPNILDRDEYFYFYQDCNGRNIFLHPMNFSMLLKGFGAELMNWPRNISFRVIDKEYYSASEETRKRWKFLRHLPLSTLFIIVEVDLQEYVSSEIIEEFASQINYRKLRREQRIKEEKHMEKIIAERERKTWSIPEWPKFEHKSDFPEFLDGYNKYGSEIPCIVGSPSVEWVPVTAITPQSLMDEKAGPSSGSFAQIAGRAPIKKSPSFPITAPSRVKPLETINTQFRGPRRHSDSEPESEDYVAVPEFRASVSDAISKALETIVFDETAQGSSATSQKKKKKNKGKVLFATGGMGSFN